MRLLFINLPPFTTKKAGNSLYWLQSSMNLGLLSVASVAYSQGHHVDVYDWLGPHQVHLLDRFETFIRDCNPDVIGLSLPSGYGEPYCGLLSELARSHVPNATIIVGGQYHAAARWRQILGRFPEVDAVCMGDGDALDWSLVPRIRSGVAVPGLASRHSCTPAIPLGSQRRSFSFGLNRLSLRLYAPSVEFSRGCPFACAFCSLSGHPTRFERSDSEVLTVQLNFWLNYWRDVRPLPVYFECPVFFCNQRSIADLEIALRPFADKIIWRAQARVDSIEPSIFPMLYSLGLRIIDLGLESAAPSMLLLMKKTRDPKTYLQKAETLIKAASDCGIRAKLNVLLYPGETGSSVSQTEAFILRHSEQIAGLSAAAALEFPGSSLSAELEGYHRRFGTRRRKPEPALLGTGIFPLDLSSTFSLEEARSWCLQITREVTTPLSYYSLKKLGYFSPTLSFEEMLRHAHNSESKSLPFRLGRSHEATESYDTIEWDQVR
jgi:radical SAM superfamily enzyme YgiQ (UPF0313 family)